MSIADAVFGAYCDGIAVSSEAYNLGVLHERLRVVTVDYHFHAFNLITWWVWFGLAVVAVLSDPVMGLPLGFIPAWFAVRVYRWMREDWANIKRDLMGPD